MNKNTSYKTMLRDRVPAVVDAALKWCKAKECWVNHVYNNFINIYVDKDMRYEATRIVLGISGKYRNFDFNKTIAWEDLTDEEAESWKSVEDWVSWFSKYSKNIKDEYDFYKNSYSRDDMITYLANKFIYTENIENAHKLVKFIIDSL